MEIKDYIISKKSIYADELEIGECFKYNNHIYLKAKMALSMVFISSDIVYVNLTNNTIYPSYEFKGICVEPVKAYVQIETVKS